MESESFRVLDMAKHLSLPVLVTTGDQIFPSALKYPAYEKIYAILGYSKLVIDEVQAYDPRAVAVIVKLIEDIVKIGGKFLLMTATLPNFVKKAIEERIGKENFNTIDRYDSEEYKKICKHKIELFEGGVEDKIMEILNKAKEDKKRVLVILNTVDKAQSIYGKLKEKIIASISSLFIQNLHLMIEKSLKRKLSVIMIKISNGHLELLVIQNLIMKRRVKYSLPRKLLKLLLI